MRNSLSPSWILIAVLSTVLILPSSWAISQEEDSTASSVVSGPALQFQILQGVGASYLFSGSQSGHFRIGVDAYLDFSDESGNGDYYNHSTSKPSGTASTGASIVDQGQEATYYKVSASLIYLANIVSYGNSRIYVGIGPMASFRHEQYAATSTTVDMREIAAQSTSSNANETKRRTWDVGPLGVLHVRSHLTGQLALSAEITVSVAHQWVSESYISTSTSSSQDYVSGGSLHMKGWVVSLSGIRIGIIVGL